MTVYVDNARTKYGRLKLSHLMADTDEELELMARDLGLSQSWKHGDHYDIGVKKRLQAVDYGAQFRTSRQLVAIRRRKRKDNVCSNM